jgi:hypothetical protein
MIPHLALRRPDPFVALIYALGAAASMALVGAAWQEWVHLPLDRTEVLAFVSSGCRSGSPPPRPRRPALRAG